MNFEQLGQSFIDLDSRLFVIVNGHMQNRALDKVMPWLTTIHETRWIYLVVFVLALELYRRGRFQGLTVLLGAGLLIAFADWFGSQVIKEYFQRPRPVFSELDVIERVSRHSGYSFTSNHASNTWALATFITLYYRSLGWVLIPIALLMAFSRIYVGVHYPSDVVVGALWGAALASVVYRVLRKKMGQK